MSRAVLTAAAVAVAAGCAGASSSPGAGDPGSSEPAVSADCSAVSSGARSPEDRARDADRKPCEILDFFGIERGMVAAELMAGRGYYTEILARAVGPEGTVYAQNNAYVLDRFADAPLTERLSSPELAHVERIDRELDAPGLPEGELDAVLLVLFYHDTYWMGVDREAMNRAVFAALEPGGVYGVIDHHAEPGSGDRDVESLHRVDGDLVVEEILEAGFVLDGESDALRHPEDDRSTNVFSDEIRGRTDRFVLRFRKPAAPIPAAEISDGP